MWLSIFSLYDFKSIITIHTCNRYFLDHLKLVQEINLHMKKCFSFPVLSKAIKVQYIFFVQLSNLLKQIPMSLLFPGVPIAVWGLLTSQSIPSPYSAGVLQYTVWYRAAEPGSSHHSMWWHLRGLRDLKKNTGLLIFLFFTVWWHCEECPTEGLKFTKSNKKWMELTGLLNVLHGNSCSERFLNNQTLFQYKFGLYLPLPR